MKPRKVSQSRTEQIQILRYQFLNHQRRLFGGTLMQWIDEVAGVTSMRHSGGNVITAAVDSLVFSQPAFLGDMLVLTGCVTYTGSTSMEVRVDTYVDDPGGERRLINQAYLVMVAIDDEGRPKQVPALELETEEEQLEWNRAKLRNELRKKRRDEEY